jgi:perosamine synthetase
MCPGESDSEAAHWFWKGVSMTKEESSVPFTRPYFDVEMLNRYATDIRNILSSGRITSGPYVSDFERAIEKRLMVGHALAVSSGTAALHAAVRGLGLSPGDEVLVPADTFVSTVNAIVYERLRPVFVDVDPSTFNISPTSLQERVTSRSRAIIVVHLGGNPCDMDSILDIAHDSRLGVVEDAAHALGATHRGRACGAIGLIGALSFDHAKLITAAEGGAVVTNDSKVAVEVRKFSNLGRSELGYEEVDTIGYNYRLSELHAALGLVSESHYERNLANRIAAGLHYRSLLSRFDWLALQSLQPESQASFHATIVRLARNSPISRDDLMKSLSARGIGTSILFRPVNLQPVYRRLIGDTKGTCPNAEELGEYGLALPMYNSITLSQVETVVDVIDQVARAGKI